MTKIVPGVQPGATIDRTALHGSDGRTLEAVFRHPMAHNLKWSDVVALFKKLGDVEHKANNEFEFRLGAERHSMRGPHGKDLTVPEVTELRHFLVRAGWSADSAPEPGVPNANADARTAPDLMVVLDHHEAKIYVVDGASAGASQPAIKPYDPHHFLHHLTHKDQSREQGQRAPEDPSFYERVAQALATSGKIVVVGHGKGHSNAAKHLTEYLRMHRPETHKRIIREIEADLSSETISQLLEIARDAFSPASSGG